MKKVFYETGPDEIKVGPVWPENAQITMKRGTPVEVDDAIAASLLKKPMFKEHKEEVGRKKEEKKSSS